MLWMTCRRGQAIRRRLLLRQFLRPSLQQPLHLLLRRRRRLLLHLPTRLLSLRTRHTRRRRHRLPLRMAPSRLPQLRRPTSRPLLPPPRVLSLKRLEARHLMGMRLCLHHPRVRMRRHWPRHLRRLCRHPPRHRSVEPRRLLLRLLQLPKLQRLLARRPHALTLVLSFSRHLNGLLLGVVLCRWRQ